MFIMLILDVETTGLDSQKHSIVSIGAVEFEKPERRFYEECRMWEGAEVNQSALDINGFTRGQIKDPTKRSLKKTVKSFIAWTESAKDKTFAGENVWFDSMMLEVSARRFGVQWPFSHRIVDLHSVCRAHIMGRGLVPPNNEGRKGLTTDTILEYAGLPSRAGFHNAIEDARLEAEAFSRLIFGKKLFEEFFSFDLPRYLKG